MTVITQVPNPVNPKQTLLIASGIVKRVFVKRLFPDGSAKHTQTVKGDMVTTHNLSLLLTKDGDDVFVGFGSTEIKNLKFENFQVKQDDKYVTIEPGMEISLAVTQQESKTEPGKFFTSGKRSAINILSTDGVEAAKSSSNTSAPTKPQSSTQSLAGASVKVYGEITAIDGIVATVTNQNDGKEFKIFLDDDQLSKVKVGGRLAGNVVDNKIPTGFKSYQPASEVKKASSGAGGSFKKDDLPIRLGNAVTVATNLHKDGVLSSDLVQEIVPATDTLRSKLGALHVGLDAYALGARVGQCVVLASQTKGVKTVADVMTKAEELFEQICSLEDVLRNPVATETVKEEVKTEDKPEAKSEVKQETQVSSQPATGVPDFDFDDEVPF